MSRLFFFVFFGPKNYSSGTNSKKLIGWKTSMISFVILSYVCLPSVCVCQCLCVCVTICFSIMHSHIWFRHLIFFSSLLLYFDNFSALLVFSFMKSVWYFFSLFSYCFVFHFIHLLLLHFVHSQGVGPGALVELLLLHSLGVMNHDTALTFLEWKREKNSFFSIKIMI